MALYRATTLQPIATVSVGFGAFNGQAAALRAASVRLFGPGASVAQDLEPEYITDRGWTPVALRLRHRPHEEDAAVPDRHRGGVGGPPVRLAPGGVRGRIPPGAGIAPVQGVDRGVGQEEVGSTAFRAASACRHQGSERQDRHPAGPEDPPG